MIRSPRPGAVAPLILSLGLFGATAGCGGGDEEPDAIPPAVPGQTEIPDAAGNGDSGEPADIPVGDAPDAPGAG